MKDKQRLQIDQHSLNFSLTEIGLFLKEARENQSLSLEELSESIYLGKEQIIALESADFKLLPEEVYIKAMIKKIAEKLNIEIHTINEIHHQKINNIKNDLERSNEEEILYSQKVINTHPSLIKHNQFNAKKSLVFLGLGLIIIFGIVSSKVILKSLENNSQKTNPFQNTIQ